MTDVWLRVPEPDAPEAIGWPLVVAAGVPAEEDRIPFARALADTLVRYSLDPGERRVVLVLVDEPPVDVRAWAVADLLPRAEPDARDAADRWAADAAASLHGWVRDRAVETTEIDGDPAVVVRDLAVDRVSGEVEHRVLITRFPPDRDAMVRLTVSTTRIGAVPDLPAVALALARRISPVPQGVP